jgi:hypothetical protein
MTPLATLRATFECVQWPEDEEDPLIWHGWCDPRNPWGTADTDPPDSPSIWGSDAGSSEPIELELPIYEAAEFIRDFPGGVWDHTESESEQSWRSGVWTSVTLHVSGIGGDAAIAIAFCDHVREES